MVLHLYQKKYNLYKFLKINDVIEESQYSTKIGTFYFYTLTKKFFWDTAAPCGSENIHNVVQLNPDEDKHYLLTPYPTLKQPLKKILPESIRAITRNPNIDLQTIGIYSKSDIQDLTCTQQFQELLTHLLLT